MKESNISFSLAAFDFCILIFWKPDHLFFRRKFKEHFGIHTMPPIVRPSSHPERKRYNKKNNCLFSNHFASQNRTCEGLPVCITKPF